jgi:hypothetical protein
MQECRGCRLRTDSRAPSCPVCGHAEPGGFTLTDPHLWRAAILLVLPLKLLSLLLA